MAHKTLQKVQVVVVVRIEDLEAATSVLSKMLGDLKDAGFLVEYGGFSLQGANPTPAIIQHVISSPAPTAPEVAVPVPVAPVSGPAAVRRGVMRKNSVHEEDKVWLLPRQQRVVQLIHRWKTIRGWTLEQAAHELGTHKSALSGVGTGYIPMTINRAEEWTSAFSRIDPVGAAHIIAEIDKIRDGLMSGVPPRD